MNSSPPRPRSPRAAVAPPSPRHADALPRTTQRAILTRLRRVEGQIRGLQRMVGEQRYCPDVLVQVSAAREGLRGAARLLMRNHLEHCATNALRSGDAERARRVYAELTDLFYQHSR